MKSKLQISSFCIFLCFSWLTLPFAHSQTDPLERNLDKGLFGDAINGEVHQYSNAEGLTSLTTAGEVVDIAVSPDNQTVFILNEDGSVKVTGSSKSEINISGGDYIAVSPDGRKLFLGGGQTVQFDALYSGAGPEFEQASGNVFLPGLAKGEIRAMAVAPDGESLYVVTEKENNDEDTASSVYIARLIIPNDVIPKETNENSANPANTQKEPYSPYFLNDSENVVQLSAEVKKINGLSISPDGNFALITALGTIKSHGTAYGIFPEKEAFSGVIVVDLNNLEQIDFILTQLGSENTEQVRRNVQLAGLRYKHPLVSYYERLYYAAFAVYRGGAGGAQLVLINMLHEAYSYVFRNVGLMDAYDELYPTDMVGAGQAGISNRGDMALVPMKYTNNLGVIPLGLSNDLRGYSSGNPPGFGFSTAAEKAINSIGFTNDEWLSLWSGRGIEDRHAWTAPNEIAFSADDSVALVGMRGGRRPYKEDASIGFVNIENTRSAINAGSYGSNVIGLPNFISLRNDNPFQRPLQVAGYNPVDIDGDSLSDHLEAFNRFNDFKTIRFGDRTQLASTNRFNITSPTDVAQLQVYPANENDMGYLLPHSGVGYRFNYQGHSKYAVNVGSAVAVSTIERVGRRWHQAYLDGEVDRPYFVVMNMSHPGGGVVYNSSGEPMHFSVRDGYQANFAYMVNGSDETHDFVTSNVPSDPLNNTEQTKEGYDAANTRKLIDFFTDEATVRKIVLDPAVGYGNGGLFEEHGESDPDSALRRDHDNYFRVLFKRDTGVSIVPNDSVIIPGSDTVAIINPDDATVIPYAVEVTDDLAEFVRIENGFYDEAGTKAIPSGENDYIPLSQVPSIVFGNSAQSPTFITYTLGTNADTGEPVYTPTGSYNLAAKILNFSASLNEALPVNGNTDTDGDGIPDFADGFNLDNLHTTSGTGGTGGTWIPGILDDQTLQTVELSIDISGSLAIDPAVALIRFQYDASFPSAISRTTKQEGARIPTYHTTYALPGEGVLRIWQQPEGAMEADDFIGPGIYRLADIGLSASGGPLRIDAVVDGVDMAPITIAIDPDGDAGPAGFIGSYTFLPGGKPDLEITADEIVASTFDAIGGADGGNGIPDFFDFGQPLAFDMPSITLPASAGASAIGIDYSASDPNAVTFEDGVYSLPAGHLRLWKSQNRTLSDYVAPGSYGVGELPSTLYVEVVAPSASKEDQRIAMRLIYEGESEEEVANTVDDHPYKISYREVTPGYTQLYYTDITAVDTFWESSFAVDARYRKFNSVGQPILDPLPQHDPEADTKKNGFYIDSYSLTPVYSTVDFSVPLYNGKSALQFRRTASIDSSLVIENETSPIEAVGGDRILGPGWRTNIGARVVYRDGIFYVYDENGQTHRYSKSGQPLPFSFQSTSTHCSDLQINADITNPDRIDSVIWTNNFHTTYYFEKFDPAQDAFAPQFIHGQALRLKYVRDPNDNAVEYLYQSGAEPYPSALREIGFPAITEPNAWQPKPEYTWNEKRITFTYEDLSGGRRLTRMTDPKGNVFTYSYDSAGKLTAVEAETGQGRNAELYEYVSESTPGLPNSGTQILYTAFSKVTNRNGNTVSLTYTAEPAIDPDFQLLKLASINSPAPAGGEPVEVTFEPTKFTADSAETTITDFNGATHVMKFTTGQAPSSISSGGGLAVNDYKIPYLKEMTRTSVGLTWKNIYTPNTLCNLLEHTDQNGTITRFEYGYVNGFDHHRYNRPSKMVFDDGRKSLVSEFTYDHQSRRLINAKSPRYFTASEALKGLFEVERKMDEKNRNPEEVKVGVIDPSNFTAALERDIKFTYHELGFPTTKVDADGRVWNTERTKSSTGWSDEIILFQGYEGAEGPQYYKKTIVYDLNGNVESEVFDYIGGSVTTTYTYDAANNRTSTTYPTGNAGTPTVSMTYDALNQIKTYTDPINTVTTYIYDARENVQSTAVADDSSTLTTQYEYNAAGQVTKTTFPKGNTVVNEYDVHNRLTATTADADPSPDVTTVYDFSKNEGSAFFASDEFKPNQVTDPLDTVTTLNYDSAYRLIGKSVNGTDASRTETYTVDAHGNITRITIPITGGNQVTTMVYDQSDRVIQTTLSGVGLSEPITTKSIYDVRGNLVAAVDGEEYYTQYEYDSMNQVIQQVSVVDTTAITFEEVGVYPYGLPDDLIGGDHISYEFTYDGRGNQLSSTFHREVAGAIIPIVSNNTYDGLGHHVSTVEAGIRNYDYTYDLNGNVRSSTVSGGTPNRTVTTGYEYDGFNRLTRTILPSVEDGESGGAVVAGTIVNTYDLNSNLLTSTNPRGTSETYTYDNYDRVITTEIKEGSSTRITTSRTYDPGGNVLTSTDGRNSTTTNTYDGFGRLKTSTDAEQNVTTYAYDALFLISVEDPRKLVHTFTHDAAGRVVTESLPTVTSELTQQEVKKGQFTITKDYDARGLVTSRKDPGEDTHSYAYDGAGRLTEYTNPESGVTAYTYDQAGNTLTYKEPDTILANGSGAPTTLTGGTHHYEYDPLGRRVKYIDPENKETTYTYDVTDNSIRTDHPDGNSSGADYDLQNRAVSVYKRGNYGGASTDIQYTLTGEVTRITDETGNRSTAAVDYLGRTISSVDPDGFQTTYQYDAASNLTRTEDPFGLIKTHEYDGINRVTRVQETRNDPANPTVPTFTKTTRYHYDANSNLEKIVDANSTELAASETLFAYDELNRVVSHTFPRKGNDPLRTYRYGYDQEGNVTVKENPKGEAIISSYDELDRIISKDYGNYAFTYGYDGRSNLTAKTHDVADVNGFSGSFTSTYRYNARNLLDSMTCSYPGAVPRTATYGYNDDGVRTSMNTLNGRAITYNINSNRLIESITGDFGAAGALSATYAYDSKLRMTDKDYGNGVKTHYTYDRRDNILAIEATREVTPGNIVEVVANEYLYNDQGHRYFEKFSYTNTSANQLDIRADVYQYDELYRVTGVKYNVPATRTPATIGPIQDTANGINLPISPGSYSSLPLVDNQWQTYEFDALHNRIVTNTSDKEIKYNLDQYTVELIDPATSADDIPDQGYARTVFIAHIGNEIYLRIFNESAVATDYNEAGFAGQPAALADLKDYLDPIWGAVPISESQQLGALSRVAVLTGLDYLYYNADALNRINRISATHFGAGSDTDVFLIHDNNGNVIRDQNNRILEWNEDNRLEVVKEEVGGIQNVVVTYIYDDAGRRCAKIFPGGDVTYYYYEGYEVCLETDGSGNVITEYLLGHTIDAPIGMVKNGAAYYFHQNTLGNVLALSNNVGEVVERYRYDIYGDFTIHDPNGQELTSGTTAISPYLYTGRRYDNETGLYYYRNRYYSPELGRFLSTDPLDYVDGMNVYAYVMGNVVNAVDPMGLKYDDDLMWLAFSVMYPELIPMYQYYSSDNKQSKNKFVYAGQSNWIWWGDSAVDETSNNYNGILGTLSELQIDSGVPNAQDAARILAERLLEYHDEATWAYKFNGNSADELILAHIAHLTEIGEFSEKFAENMSAFGDIVGGFHPITPFYEALSGEAISSGRELEGWERGISAIPLLGHIRKAKNVDDLARMVLRHGDELEDSADLGKQPAKMRARVRIPTGAAFNRWWDETSYKKFMEAWNGRGGRSAIENELRKQVSRKGGYHEWYMVSNAPRFKKWNATSKQLSEMSQSIDELNMVAKNWEHTGGLSGSSGEFSKMFHDSLNEIIKNSRSLNDYKKRVINWADTADFLENGAQDLPKFFQR